MVALSTFENPNVMVKNFVGEHELLVPVSGMMTKVSVNEYESQVRKLAYGLMVKDYKHGDSIMVLDEVSQAISFIKAGCELAHLNVMSFSDSQNDENLISVLSDSSVSAIFVMNQTNVEYLKSLIKSAGLNIDVYSVLGSESKTSINYLQIIGSIWELKYKPLVDRTMREIIFNS